LKRVGDPQWCTDRPPARRQLLTIEEVDVVEENDDGATVDLTYSVEGNPDERTEQFGLGRNDDEWVIVSSEDG